MKKTESECVDCGKPCLHHGCPYYSVTRYYCDNCKEENNPLYEWNNEEWCIECIKNELTVIEGSEE